MSNAVTSLYKGGLRKLIHAIILLPDHGRICISQMIFKRDNIEVPKRSLELNGALQSICGQLLACSLNS